MDALKFIEERNRMCDYYKQGSGGECGDCPAYEFSCSSVQFVTAEYIAAVEKWSQEHPRKTRQDVFLEQWPDANVLGGYLRICPRDLYNSERFGCGETICSICKKKFWMHEVARDG